MISSEGGIFGMISTCVFLLSFFGNGSFIFYLIISKVKTSVDKLILTLAILELLVVALGIPMVTDIWLGMPYNNGSFGCQGMVPFYYIVYFSEVFNLSLIAIYIEQKLKGEEKVQKHITGIICFVYIGSIIMVLPLFGVNNLVKRVNGKGEEFCIEDWNINAGRIFHVMSIGIQLLFPAIIFFLFHKKSHRILQCIRNSIDTKNVRAKYQSFSKVIAETGDNSEAQYLKFSQSEEMNLEMEHLYQRENSVSSIQKDEETAKVSVQIFTNEITIEKINSLSPLWKGEKPDTKWKQENEYQKLVLSIKWLKYVKNLFTISFTASLLFILCTLPYCIMIAYALYEDPSNYNPTERTIAKVLFLLRFTPSVVNPWLFSLGIVKYRRNICCKSCKVNSLYAKV